MLRNIGNCYCESTHRLLQKYDKNAQKGALSHKYIFELRSVSLTIKQNQR